MVCLLWLESPMECRRFEVRSQSRWVPRNSAPCRCFRSTKYKRLWATVCEPEQVNNSDVNTDSTAIDGARTDIHSRMNGRQRQTCSQKDRRTDRQAIADMLTSTDRQMNRRVQTNMLTSEISAPSVSMTKTPRSLVHLTSLMLGTADGGKKLLWLRRWKFWKDNCALCFTGV